MSNWIKWNGGKCPVAKGTLVDVIHRDGDKGYDKVVGKMGTGRGNAAAVEWGHTGGGADIVKYRLCEPDLQSRVNDASLQQEIRIGSGVAPGVHSGPVYDVVQRPAHYTQSNIECIDAIAAAVKGKSGIEAVCVANVIKYLWRYEIKDGVESVRKAQWYLDRLVKELSK